MPEPRGSRQAPFGPALAPLSAPFALAVLTRRWLYDRGLLAAARPPLFTLSVGGLEVGGTGKTPVTAWVLGILREAGRRPGLLTRGYGRKERGLVVRAVGEEASPARLGDEPAMLVQEGLDVPVAACADRRVGAAALVQAGCDTLVLDDGFSHRRLGRHLDIVVLRGEAPLGDNGHLMPWGSLREPPSSLRRAQVVWLHHRASAAVEPAAALRAHLGSAVIVLSEARPGPARDLLGKDVALAGRPVLAAAGIARPRELAASLERCGAEVRELVALADHHAYGPDDVQRLGRRAAALGAEAVVVTPKDRVKLAPLWRGPPLYVLGTAVHVVAGEAALRALLPLGDRVDSTPRSG